MLQVREARSNLAKGDKEKEAKQAELQQGIETKRMLEAQQEEARALATNVCNICRLFWLPWTSLSSSQLAEELSTAAPRLSELQATAEKAATDLARADRNLQKTKEEMQEVQGACRVGVLSKLCTPAHRAYGRQLAAAAAAHASRRG